MVKTSPKFGAWAVGSIAGVTGVKYLLGGALALIDDGVTSSVLVQDIVPLTLACGFLLCIGAGAFVDGATWARGYGIVILAAVGALSLPAIRMGDPVIIFESVAGTISILYLLVRDPIKRKEVTQVDDSDSATRIGSTLR
jgi:hypothetical protein